MVEILTKRLRLRPFRADDLPAFVAYRREPEVARYQAWDTTYSMIDAERFLASQEDVEFGGMGAWVQLAAIDLLVGHYVAIARYMSSPISRPPPRSASLSRRLVRARA